MVDKNYQAPDFEIKIFEANRAIMEGKLSGVDTDDGDDMFE